MNDYVIIPKGNEETKRKMNEVGFKTIELEMSEFQKQDSGIELLVTMLSKNRKFR